MSLAGPPARAGIRIATAGWALPRAVADRFPAEGSGLQRYAARLDAAEINSTFYRSHRASTYARWAEATPEGFQFAMKLPRAITHDARLVGALPQVAAFRAEAGALGSRLGPLLVQLPPSLAFDAAIADVFFAGLRELWPEAVVCEPRHPSWFEAQADALLCTHRVARVAADPARHPDAGRPGGWTGLAYWRLHGSPRMYRSPYDDDSLASVAEDILAFTGGEAWCVFDNTASGAAAADALRLRERLFG